MSSSDSESTSSGLTSVKSVVGSPGIQELDLDIVMETDATVGSVGSSDDNDTNHASTHDTETADFCRSHHEL